MFVCPICEVENRPDAKFCRKCGQSRSALEQHLAVTASTRASGSVDATSSAAPLTLAGAGATGAVNRPAESSSPGPAAVNRPAESSSPAADKTDAKAPSALQRSDNGAAVVSPEVPSGNGAVIGTKPEPRAVGGPQQLHEPPTAAQAVEAAGRPAPAPAPGSVDKPAPASAAESVVKPAPASAPAAVVKPAPASAPASVGQPAPAAAPGSVVKPAPASAPAPTPEAASVSPGAPAVAPEGSANQPTATSAKADQGEPSRTSVGEPKPLTYTLSTTAAPSPPKASHDFSAPQCPACWAALRASDRYCCWCGEPQPLRAVPFMKVCVDCNTQLPEKANFCHACGSDVSGRFKNKVRFPVELFREEDSEFFPRFDA